MFFKKKKAVKKQSHLDKVVTGVILGAAIGSVLGVGLAPKKGQETRDEIGRKANKWFGNIKDRLFTKNKKSSTKSQSSGSAHTRPLPPKTIKKLPEEV